MLSLFVFATKLIVKGERPLNFAQERKPIQESLYASSTFILQHIESLESFHNFKSLETYPRGELSGSGNVIQNRSALSGY